MCRAIKAWTTNAGSLTLAFGTNSALQVYWSGTLYDITPAGLTPGAVDSSGSAPGYGTGPYGLETYSVPASQAYARSWSLDTWGENLIACPRGGTLFRWQNDPTAEAVEIANAPDEITAVVTTIERQVLALGCNEEARPTSTACASGAATSRISTTGRRRPPTMRSN